MSITNRFRTFGALTILVGVIVVAGGVALIKSAD